MAHAEGEIDRLAITPYAVLFTADGEERRVGMGRRQGFAARVFIRVSGEIVAWKGQFGRGPHDFAKVEDGMGFRRWSWQWVRLNADRTLALVVDIT